MASLALASSGPALGGGGDSKALADGRRGRRPCRAPLSFGKLAGGMMATASVQLLQQQQLHPGQLKEPCVASPQPGTTIAAPSGALEQGGCVPA